MNTKASIFQSAYLKLTMWYLAIVMIISLGFSVAVYQFGTNEVSYGLHHQTQRIFKRYPIFGYDPVLRPIDDDLTRASHHLLLELVYFNVLVLVGAGLASYFLARRTLQPIEAAHERQKRFTADVSHELRTPLTSLKMTSEVALLDKQIAKSELQTALASNLEDAAKMEALINNLLRLTRLDDSDAESNMEQTNAQLLLQTAVEQIAPSAKAKNISITVSEAAIPVQTDVTAITQALVILLDNAIKYSPQGSAIKLSAHKTSNSIRLEIIDQGIGIAPDALPHVFDRFYRADVARTKTDDSSGYGLGLSIAKLLVERQKGSITLTSAVQKGTTATILLPQSK